MQQAHIATVGASTIEQRSVLTQVTWIVGFAALTAVGAQIEIPHQPVPYTLQTFFVLLAGALLGKRNGSISQGVYLLAGLLGLPVFSGFGFGLTRLLGPAGGYLLAFPVAAFVVGLLISQNASLLWSCISMAVGLVIIFSLGTLQLNFIYFHDWSAAVGNGLLIFSWWDGVKLAAAAMIATAVLRRRNHTGG
jgi:biotin transport system substrate-specific component